MPNNYTNLAIRSDTYKKLKARKEVHGMTYDELIKELLEK